MADFVSKEKRSKIMRGVKQKYTKPEILVRKVLHRQGYRFRLHRKDLAGKLDIVLPRFKPSIFVHGCFWHQHQGCKDGREPTSDVDCWSPKLASNVERDAEKAAGLQASGWNVTTIWECEARNPEVLESKIGALFETGPKNSTRT